MNFFMSGTPSVHEYIDLENSLCDHRLFSLHGDYLNATMKYVRYVKEQRNANPDYKYPKNIMLDSGAFTAWNKGHVTSLVEVTASYKLFMKESEGLYDTIVGINLDKIPGEKGRDPTLAELKEAVEVSDVNYVALREIFGDVILPVFHQGEPDERMYEVAEMTRYICLSPRNDMSETRRKIWSQERHALLHDKYPLCQTHGLATTGNNMLRDVPWHSVDSASWVHHAAFGMIDIFLGTRYKGFFISDEGGKQREGEIHLGGEDTANMSPIKRAWLINRAEEYGIPYDTLRTNNIARRIVCLGELARYARWAGEYKEKNKITTQHTLLGEI